MPPEGDDDDFAAEALKQGRTRAPTESGVHCDGDKRIWRKRDRSSQSPRPSRHRRNSQGGNSDDSLKCDGNEDESNKRRRKLSSASFEQAELAYRSVSRSGSRSESCSRAVKGGTAAEQRQKATTRRRSETGSRSSGSNSRISGEDERAKTGFSHTQVNVAPKRASKWDVARPDAVIPAAAALMMTQPLEDRRCRRLYVGNLPADVDGPAIVQFFNGALVAATGQDYATVAATGLLPVLKAEVGSKRPDAPNDHRYCFLEFRTSADADITLKLDGIPFKGAPLRIGRPNDYVPSAQPSLPTLASAGLHGAEATGRPLFNPHRLYVANLPPEMSEGEVDALLRELGQLRLLKLVVDPASGQSLCAGYFEYEDEALTDKAVETFNGKEVRGRSLVVGRGIPSGSSITGTAAEAVSSAISKQNESWQKLQQQVPSTGGTGVGALSTLSNGPIKQKSMTQKILGNALIGLQVRTARKQGEIPSPVVQLLNVVYTEDVIKDDDYNEILEEVRAEAAKYGTLENIVIPRPAPDLAYREGVGKIFLHYADVTAARKARQEFNGRKYEEKKVVCAAFYPLQVFLAKKYSLLE